MYWREVREGGSEGVLVGLAKAYQQSGGERTVSKTEVVVLRNGHTVDVDHSRGNIASMILGHISGFPSIGMCLTTYYSAYPAIANQSLATLFPHLENMKDYLLKSDPGNPFSGSAQHSTKQQKQCRSNRQKGTRPTNQANPRSQANQRTPRWSPHGPTLLAATPAPTPTTNTDYAPYVAEIQRLQAMLAAQAQSPYPDAQFGMPVPPQPPRSPHPDPVSSTVGYMVSPQPATAFSASRPREFYCWLHG
jgi:hypothetical protein